MNRRIVFILIVLSAVQVWAAGNTISIPLSQQMFYRMPQDDPTGSTPDPTDPNQFRATLTGNILHIDTQQDAVSYVVVREQSSDRQGEDYFYSISFGEVECVITHPGLYTIEIGYWKTDFVGQIAVRGINYYAFDGSLIGVAPYQPVEDLGAYILRVTTSLGITTTKIYQKP